MTARDPGSPPVRLLFIVPSFHGGGAEFVARTWMTWLVSQGYDVSVVLTSAKSGGPHAPSGIRAKSLSGRRGHLAKAAGLRSAIRELRPHVAIALQSYPNLLLLTAGSVLAPAERPKILISERNLVSLGLPEADLAHRIKIWFAKRLYRRADHVIAISHPVAGELVAGFGVRGERITVVPNPATAKVRAVASPARTLGASTGIQLVLACRLVRQKRPALAIDAAAELIRRGIPTEVVSFGGGPLAESLVAAAQRSGVKFIQHGWVEDWFEHFGAGAVVILPSDREGFGNVLVEAAAAGYPSVAISGALGVADAIVPGITGELSLSSSPTHLADAVERASGLTLRNIEPWLRRFSVEQSGRDLESVFLSVLGTKFP